MVADHSQGKQIFFGPRLEFLYARLGMTSPANLPLWWHPGTSYSMDRETEVEKSWNDAKFDVLIFAKHDRTAFPGPLFPQKLALDVDRDYRVDASLDAIDVYYRVVPSSAQPASRPAAR